LYYSDNDDDILREVDNEAHREQYLKDMLIQASQRRDVENVENILTHILARINRSVYNLRALAYKAIEWFRKKY
jgi:hypothetical protein